MNLYRVIDVWKKLDKASAVRYRCFESLKSTVYQDLRPYSENRSAAKYYV
jgi:hypothetical protein